MKTISLQTNKKDQVIDLTPFVEEELALHPSGEGTCTVFVAHTTCAVTTADLDPGTDLDILDALRSIIPHIRYRHPHNPLHAPDHILASIIGPSVTVPVKDKKSVLGIWQRIILIELDGPRERNIVLSVIIG